MLSLFSRLLEPEMNSSRVAHLLVHLLGVDISITSLKNDIERHPEYPGLLSITDVLNSYGIETLIANFEYENFFNIPTPFVAQIKGGKDEIVSFAVVKDIKDEMVSFYDQERYKWRSASKAEFFKRCSGIIMLAEVGENAGEKEYKKQIVNERKVRIVSWLTAWSLPIIITVSGALAFIQYGNSILLSLIFLLFTLAGSIVATVLIWYELDQYNPVLQQICGAKKETDCGAILHSRASKIFGISWSSIGFSYFTGSVLFLLFSGITNPLSLFVLAWINVVASIYIIYSVYFQWRVAKQWCVLCLTIQCLLGLQLVTAQIGGWYSSFGFDVIDAHLVLQLLTVFIIPFIVFSITFPALQTAKESENNRAKLQRMKHNPQIFGALLQKQKLLTETSDGLGITIGNPKAQYKIIKVCNPYCGPCALAHNPIEALLSNNPDVQLQIIFSVTNRSDDYRGLPVKHLLAVADIKDERLMKQALNDWYLPENKDYNVFAEKYQMEGEINDQGLKIEAMEKWCTNVEIRFTPTFFVSLKASEGEEDKYYQLPEIYSVNDLKYFFYS